MNLGKFHSILLMGQRELSANESAVANFCAMLDNMMSHPGDAQFMRQFNALRSNLESKSDGIFPSGFAAGSKKFLEEAGIRPYLSDQLRSNIRAILNENSLTPMLAREQISGLQSEIGRTRSAVETILQGFVYLRIDHESPVAQECEASFLFPADFIGGRLDKFAAEVKEVDRTLGNLSEMATGDRKSGCKIHSVASSDFLIHVVISALSTARLFAKFISEVIGIYDKLQKAKQWTRQTERNKHFGEKAIAEMKKDIERIKSEEVERVVSVLIKDVNPDNSKGRSNELKIEMRRSINLQLHKMDNGVEVHIHLPPHPIREKGGSSSDKGRKKQNGKVLLDQDKRLRLTIERILAEMPEVEIDEKARLGLPAPSESDSDDADSA